MTLTSHEVDGCTVRLIRHGRLVNTFDFGGCGFAPIVASGLARALVGQFGHTSVEAQRQSWRCLRKFALFLVSSRIEQEPCLPPDSLVQFREWLGCSRLSASTAQSALNIVTAALGWCSRNVPGMLSPNTRLVVQGFVRSPPVVRKALTLEEMKAILAACYSEIEKVEARLAVGRRVLTRHPADADERKLTDLVSRLLDLGQGDLPRLNDIYNSRLGLGPRVRELGGTRALLRNLWLTPDGLFPFFLAILAQTSGNPYAVLSLGRDCVWPHPLREDLERIVWLKLRSHSEQRGEFPKGKKWSAPELCRRLATLNEGLIEHTSPDERNRLFICKKTARDVGVMKFQMLHILLDLFIERHRLPKFDLKDLRRGGAAAHHHEAGSIVAAQRRLNHQSPVTTAKYTKIEDRSHAHDAVIRQFQGQLMSGKRQSREGPMPAETPLGPHETVFGFTCTNPFAGMAPGSTAGSLCLQFQKCATCPGALITLDDAQVVARLLATSRALNDARERSLREGWWPRFKEAYEPTRLILQDELLPGVAPRVRERAASLPTAAAMLHLE